jgi:hypothetical protein
VAERLPPLMLPAVAREVGATRLGCQGCSMPWLGARPMPSLVWPAHLCTSVETLPGTLAELHRRRVRLLLRDWPDDGATVEIAGLLAADDLVVDAQRRLRAEAIRAGHSVPTLVAPGLDASPGPPAKQNPLG